MWFILMAMYINSNDLFGLKNNSNTINCDASDRKMIQTIRLQEKFFDKKE